MTSTDNRLPTMRTISSRVISKLTDLISDGKTIRFIISTGTVTPAEVNLMRHLTVLHLKKIRSIDLYEILCSLHATYFAANQDAEMDSMIIESYKNLTHDLSAKKGTEQLVIAMKESLETGQLLTVAEINNHLAAIRTLHHQNIANKRKQNKAESQQNGSVNAVAELPKV